jgi:hypothetical protein
MRLEALLAKSNRPISHRQLPILLGMCVGFVARRKGVVGIIALLTVLFVTGRVAGQGNATLASNHQHANPNACLREAFSSGLKDRSV